LLHGDLHFIRIRKSAMLLKMNLPEHFDRDELENRILQTIGNQNIDYARVRCTIFRETPGLYTPLENNCTIVLEITAQAAPGYEWKENGISLGIYREMSKNGNFVSTLKTTSCLINVMAGIYARENELDECLIYNDSGRVCEGIGSNIFTYNGEFLNTPPLSEYCVDGVMRKVVINLAQEYGYTVIEQPITDVNVNTSDEIFFTSATSGIRWVREFNNKRYKQNVAKVLFEKLNHLLI
jgi:branched-chain amino acid aminotransferase